MAITTTIQIAKDRGFEQLVYNETVSNTTTKDISLDISTIPYGTTLHSRLKYTNGDIASNWSRSVSFTALSTKNVIGIAMDMSSCTFSWIDMAGNRLSYFDWHEHPVYTSMSMVTTDTSRSACQFTKIPLFYINTATSGPAGTYSEGKKCWWISDQPVPGFRPHPAFKRSSNRSNGKYIINDAVYIGTYFGHLESLSGSGSCIGSKRNTTWHTGSSVNDYRTYCNNRNSSSYDQSGYRIFDVHDMGLIRLLTLIASGEPQTTRKWGYSTSSTSYNGTTDNKLIFFGTKSNPTVWIDDMWMRRYWYVDKLTITNGYVHIINPFDGSEASGPGENTYSRTPARGFMHDVCSGRITIGDDVHDLMEYFLPRTVSGSESSSAFRSWWETDEIFRQAINYIWFGSCYDRWDMPSQATPETLGLFHLNIDNDPTYSTVGCRICKN